MERNYLIQGIALLTVPFWKAVPGICAYEGSPWISISHAVDVWSWVCIWRSWTEIKPRPKIWWDRRKSRAYWNSRETAFTAPIFSVRKLAQDLHSNTSPLKNQDMQGKIKINLVGNVQTTINSLMRNHLCSDWKRKRSFRLGQNKDCKKLKR